MEKLLEYFIPDYYWLELYLFKNKRLIRGTATIEGEVKSDYIRFHAVNMKIKTVEFKPLEWVGGSDDQEFEPCPYEYDGQELKIHLTEDSRVQIAKQAKINYDEDLDDRQMVSFKIEYEAPITANMEGCYLSSYEHNGAKKEIIATQFESHYARTAFPCIDEPAAKARFHLVLLTPDITPEDVVLSNMPLYSKDINRYTFETTPLMSTYLLAWVVGPFQNISSVNKKGVRVTSYCALNQKIESLIFANEAAMKALEYYDEKFGTEYPLAKLDQVALPDFEAGAMENWGLVTYRESMMLADKNASLDLKRSVATTVTHELAHQWFGDLVTMKWWDDLWLNESFATIMEYYATDALYPELNIWSDFFAHDCIAALQRDALRGVQSVKQAVSHPSEISTLFDGAIVYAKGARLILMLMHLMGEENFYQGLNYYFRKYRYGNAVDDNLWLALQPYADFNIKDFMLAWLSQPGYPSLQVTKNGNQTFWAQQRFLIDGTTDDSKWPLPKVQDDMSGHYLIDLSTTEFEAKLGDFAHLDLEQKLRLLIDRLLLAKAGHVPSSSLLDLLQKCQSEQSAAIWDVMETIIATIKIFITPESSTENNYKLFLRQLISPNLAKLQLPHGLDATTPDQNTLELRNLLLGLACYSEDEAILQSLAKLYLPNLESLDSELRSYILAAQMYFNEAETFNYLLQQYQTLSDADLRSDLLYCLTIHSKSPDHLKTLLSLLQKPEIVRPQDHLFLYIYLLRNHHSRTQALDWLIENWNYLEKLTGDKSIEDYIKYTANTLRTDRDVQKFYTFCDTLRENPTLSRAIKTAHTELDARLALIRSESAAIATKLEELAEATHTEP